MAGRVVVRIGESSDWIRSARSFQIPGPVHTSCELSAGLELSGRPIRELRRRGNLDLAAAKVSWISSSESGSSMYR